MRFGVCYRFKNSSNTGVWELRSDQNHPKTPQHANNKAPHRLHFGTGPNLRGRTWLGAKSFFSCGNHLLKQGLAVQTKVCRFTREERAQGKDPTDVQENTKMAPEGSGLQVVDGTCAPPVEPANCPYVISWSIYDMCSRVYKCICPVEQHSMFSINTGTRAQKGWGELGEAGRENPF